MREIIANQFPQGRIGVHEDRLASAADRLDSFWIERIVLQPQRVFHFYTYEVTLREAYDWHAGEIRSIIALLFERLLDVESFVNDAIGSAL